MTRPDDLQVLFDAAETAVAQSPRGSVAAKAAAARVFDRLRSHDGTPQFQAMAPAALPVCDHLPQAIASAYPVRRALTTALSALAARLTWTRRLSARPEDGAFWDGHANVMLAGPAGLEVRDDLWLGATLMAPGVTYTDHSHPPEETYLPLTPGAWWNAAMDWTDPGADGLIYNPPGITHAMRALPDQPFLALWFLPV
ncbi:MAG: transcriptional regulator [Rhodobacteraceae bacterium PARR1]|nr:MAG: transcriptional regulator [Rhodobacteraceae bacterium PARR1]